MTCAGALEYSSEEEFRPPTERTLQADHPYWSQWIFFCYPLLGSQKDDMTVCFRSPTDVVSIHTPKQHTIEKVATGERFTKDDMDTLGNQGTTSCSRIILVVSSDR